MIFHGESLGAWYRGNGRCTFYVWAPKARRVVVHLFPPNERRVEMKPAPYGYFEATVQGVQPGTRYKYVLHGDDEYPDLASHFHPMGFTAPPR